MEDAVVCSWPLDPESQDVPQFVAKDDTPCEIRCTLQQPIGAVIISSSARYCELRTADQAGAYLATVRGVGEPEGGYGLALDVQASCSLPTHAVVVRMLSLQEKGKFCLHSLEVVAADPEHPVAATPQETQMAAVRQLLQDAQTGDKGDARQQLMASIAQAALQKEALQRQQGNGAVESESEGWRGGGAVMTAANCTEGKSSQGMAAHEVHSLEAFVAAIDATTERALNKFRIGVEQILEDSLAGFERRLRQIMQQHDPP